MTIDQVIAAQEANEAAARACLIDFTTFASRRAELARAESAAMAAIMARIAKATLSVA